MSLEVRHAPDENGPINRFPLPKGGAEMVKVRMSTAIVFALVFAFAAPCQADEDPAPVGSEWVGTFIRFGRKDENGNRISSSDARIKIVHREDVKFKAELWLDRNSKGLALE